MEFACSRTVTDFSDCERPPKQKVSIVYSIVIAIFVKAWQVTRRVSKDDWTEWLRRLSVELLKESPSPVLRSCQVLAQEYNPLARYT